MKKEIIPLAEKKRRYSVMDIWNYPEKDVKEFISEIQENAFYVGGDLFVRLDFIEKKAGDKLKWKYMKL